MTRSPLLDVARRTSYHRSLDGIGQGGIPSGQVGEVESNVGLDERARTELVCQEDAHQQVEGVRVRVRGGLYELAEHAQGVQECRRLWCQDQRAVTSPRQEKSLKQTYIGLGQSDWRPRRRGGDDARLSGDEDEGEGCQGRRRGAAENSETFKTCLRSWGRGKRKMNYL